MIPSVIAVIFMIFPFLVFGKTAGPGSVTVDDCVSFTGMTKDQCQEMVDKFKNMTPPADGAKMMPSQNGQGQPPASGVIGEKPTPGTRAKTDTVTTNDAEIEKISRLRAEKEQQLSQAERRITKIIEFLKLKDLETSEAENAFEIFKAKASAVSNAFNAYIQELNNTKTDTSETAATAVQNAKEQIKTALNDLRDSYHTLRIALDDAVAKLDQ